MHRAPTTVPMRGVYRWHRRHRCPSCGDPATFVSGGRRRADKAHEFCGRCWRRAQAEARRGAAGA